MTAGWILLLALRGVNTLPQDPFPVRFLGTDFGRSVTVRLDGRFVESTWAGRLTFADQNRRWWSYCANPRAPITPGMDFPMLARSSWSLGGNRRLAGNIIAHCFGKANSADACAALQLAVWEAIEDGGPTANFSAGRFAVQASGNLQQMAAQFYDSGEIDGNAIFLQAGGGGQDQLTN
jgi:hypothetical protein